MSPIYLLILIILLAIVRVIIHFNKSIDKTEKKMKSTIELIDSIVIAGATALIVITFIMRTFFIPSSSMVPTLQIGDFLFVNKFVYRFYQPARHDVVVFHPPEVTGIKGRDFIKRIVAVQGDTVEVKNGKLYLNDQPQEELYIAEPLDYTMEKLTVPEDCLFVMGDNRNNSDDSHMWGFLPKKNLVGKAMVIIFPFNRMGVIK